MMGVLCTSDSPHMTLHFLHPSSIHLVVWDTPRYEKIEQSSDIITRTEFVVREKPTVIDVHDSLF